MDDGFWTQETKDQFNSLDVLKQAGGDLSDQKSLKSNRYAHQWYQDDGIFVMRIEDFIQHFN
jgi:hypothetical protein